MLGTEMLQECINCVDVEPQKAICNFVLYHPSDDALPDNNCESLLQATWGGNFLRYDNHPARASVLSSPQKKIVGGGRGQDAECNGVIGLSIQYLRMM